MNPGSEATRRGHPVPGNRWDLLPAGDSAPAGGEAPAPAISVVVPYYQDQAGLDLLLQALTAQDHPAGRMQLIVADDGSPRPPRLPAGLPFDASVVRQEDRGFRASAARALGAAAAEGDVLAFLDGDMIPAPGYLSAAARLPALSPEAVVVGRRRHLDAALLETGWRPGDPVPAESVLQEPAWLREAYARTENLLHADSTAYRFVISAVLTVAREVYADAGGFDPAFVGYGGEDWDLAHRMWRVGGLLAHDPEAVSWHAGPDFAGREDPVQARRLKNHESMVLAPRISAPTARGLALGLAGPGAPGVDRPAAPETPEPAEAPGPSPTSARGPRVEVTVPLGEGSQAAGVLCVDAVLQVVPSAVVTVVVDRAAGEPLPEPVRACLTDPRVRWRRGEGPVADWSVELNVPLRPAGAGVRPHPAAVSDWLLGLEREGLDRVEVVAPSSSVPRVLATLTSSRARWRRRRWGAVDPTPTRRIDVGQLGWEELEEEPDLEAWWGGWG